MRHALLRLTGLLLVLMLVLTGCNLIGIDPIMQLDEDLAALKKQYSGVVAKYDGGQVTQEDVMASFTSQYGYMSQMYSMYGLTMSADVITNIEQSVAEDAVRNVAIAKQLETRGLKLDDDKLAEVQSEADEHYKEAYDSFYPNAKGENEEVRVKQTEYALATNGFTKDGLYAIELASANYDLIEQTVRDEITEVTDDELQAAYDEKVKSDEDTYTNAPGSLGSTMTSDSTTVYWLPEGYRTVKHILIKPEDEVLSAVTSARSALKSAQKNLEEYQAELEALNSADKDEAAEGDEDAAAEPTEAPRTAEAIQADIDATTASLDSLKADVEKAEADCLASVQDKLDEIYGKLDAGEDFEALIEAYGEDPGMQNEPTKTRGYYVSSASTNWDENFTAGAMLLEKVGDVSKTPVIGTSGVHIIRYESDVTPGAVPLEDIREKLYETTLDSMKHDHFETELESWISALNPTYDISAFNFGE